MPLLLLWGLSAFNSYVSALQAATQAYDRTLLSSARTVSERLVVHNGKLQVNVPWVVLDSFELNMNDRLYYKVLMHRRTRPVSRQQLFDQVFSLNDDVSPESIDLYIHRLRKKLTGSGVRITTLRGLGYVLECGDEVG